MPANRSSWICVAPALARTEDTVDRLLIQIHTAARASADGKELTATLHLLLAVLVRVKTEVNATLDQRGTLTHAVASMEPQEAIAKLYLLIRVMQRLVRMEASAVKDPLGMLSSANASKAGPAKNAQYNPILAVRHLVKIMEAAKLVQHSESTSALASTATVVSIAHRHLIRARVILVSTEVTVKWDPPLRISSALVTTVIQEPTAVWLLLIRVAAVLVKTRECAAEVRPGTPTCAAALTATATKTAEHRSIHVSPLLALTKEFAQRDKIGRISNVLAFTASVVLPAILHLVLVVRGRVRMAELVIRDRLKMLSSVFA